MPQGGGIDALTRAAQLVPELTERKRLLDMHTNICTSLLSEIKVAVSSWTLAHAHALQERELDNFFSLESAIVSGSVYNAKSALMQVRGARRKEGYREGEERGGKGVAGRRRRREIWRRRSRGKSLGANEEAAGVWT
eukprot:768162-Hanusia_phi.AAC.1